MSWPSNTMDIPPKVSHQPGFNLYADHGDRILRAMTALIVLASVFVFLRLMSRHLTRVGFWWDDVLMVVALLLAIAPCISNIVAVKTFGFGKHIYVFGTSGAMEATKGFLHSLYFFQIFFTLATGMTKLTLLAFYRRIFPIAELKLSLLIMTAVVLSYTVAFSALNIFECRPVRDYWKPEQSSHCISRINNLIISGSINTVIDFAVVCLPIPLLWRLRTSKRQKCVLTGIFLTVGFVCFVGIVRIVGFSKVDPKDVTWNFVSVSIWSSVEPIVGILGACLPALRPLIALLLDNTACRYFVATASKVFQSSTTSSVLKSNQSKSKNGDSANFARLEDNDGTTKAQRFLWQDPEGLRVFDHETDGHNTTVHGGRGQADQNDGDVIEMERISDVEPPKGAIRVKTEIFLSSSKRLDYNDRLY